VRPEHRAMVSPDTVDNDETRRLLLIAHIYAQLGDCYAKLAENEREQSLLHDMQPKSPNPQTPVHQDVNGETSSTPQ
jgi:hypothetical protein